jgi:hypothetical protein
MILAKAAQIAAFSAALILCFCGGASCYAAATPNDQIIIVKQTTNR